MLSRRDCPTVSLVRAVVRRIRNIKDLAQECNKTTLTEVYAAWFFWAFGDQTEENVGYFGAKYTDFYVVRVKEFLDRRTQTMMSFAEKLEVTN